MAALIAALRRPRPGLTRPAIMIDVPGPIFSADGYLALFGGLDAGLPALAADPLLAGVDDQAPLRRLATDLAAAGRQPELRALLLTSAETDAGPVNVWFRAHETHGSADGFLADVALARRHAAHLADEVLFGLVAASVRSRRGRVSGDLVRLLVADGLWTPEQALARVRAPGVTGCCGPSNSSRSCRRPGTRSSSRTRSPRCGKAATGTGTSTPPSTCCPTCRPAGGRTSSPRPWTRRWD
ncbi:hypothetical protein GCM10027610_055150 [Dactylosporangium cerinum]